MGILHTHYKAELLHRIIEATGKVYKDDFSLAKQTQKHRKILTKEVSAYKPILTMELKNITCLRNLTVRRAANMIDCNKM